jgi:hypothetical protein
VALRVAKVVALNASRFFEYGKVRRKQERHSRYLFDHLLACQTRPVGDGNVEWKWLLESNMLTPQDPSAEHA